MCSLSAVIASLTIDLYKLYIGFNVFSVRPLNVFNLFAAVHVTVTL